MFYLHQQNHFYNHNLERDGSWPPLVNLLFEVIAHREQLAIKPKAFGGRRRKFARRNRARGRHV